MKLLTYMRENGLSDEHFAEIVGAGVSRFKVKKWKYRETPPSLEDVARIEVVTKGAVRLEDFLETPHADEDGPAPLSPQQTIEGDAA